MISKGTAIKASFFLDKLLFKAGPLAAMIYLGAENQDTIQEYLGKATEITGILRTQAELGGLADSIAKEYQWNNKFPANFEAFVAKNMQSGDESRDVTKDAWNMKFRFEPGKDSFIVRSCGPDRKCRTDDDIVVEKRNLNKHGTLAR